MSARMAATGVARGPWGLSLLLLGLGLLALGSVFWIEVSNAVSTWERSAAYNHGWLVLPVAIWLAWTRRHRLAGLAPRPEPWAVVPALAAGVAWLAAERLGIMEGRQLAALGTMLALVLAVMGWRVCRAMAAPLAYLVFLVPFGAFMVPVLQRLTAWMITSGLTVLGIPFYADDLIIEIPAGVFLVAEACAGLRFIIASLAFGALYALVMFRTPGRRLLVMVLALAVPILANGIRALGIVVLGHHLGSAQAAAADHLIYGWVFFSVVILLLTLAGLPFRQDSAEPPAPRPNPAAQRLAPRGGALAVATGLALGAALVGPAVALALTGQAGTPPVARVIPLVAPDGCAAPPGGAVLRCGAATTITARQVPFSPRGTWSALVAERYRLIGQDDEALTFTMTAGGVRWQGRQSGNGVWLFASWLDGAAVGDGVRTRLAQALNSVTSQGGRPVLVVVELLGGAGPGAEDLRRDRALLQRVLEAQVEGGATGLIRAPAALSRQGA